MDKACKIVLFLCLVVSFLASSSSAQTCRNQTFSNNNQYANCSDLPVLNCSLHWTYDEAAGTVDMAFRHTNTTTSRWSAWAINPSAPRMLGSQALVAYVNSSGVAHAFTSSIDSMTPSMQQSNLSFGVPNISATFENNEMTIFAVLSISSNLSSTNQVWQEGPVSNDRLGIHPTTGANVQSVGSVNFK